MPPQPPGASGLYHGEPSIPGAAPIEVPAPQSFGLINHSIALRTHSSKFPIERELILSSDKGSSKIPLMQEARTPSGIRRSNGMSLLTRPTGSIAPDHPPHIHAWNSQQLGHNQQDIVGQQAVTVGGSVSSGVSGVGGAIPRTPTRLPEDVTALAERDMSGKDKDGNKNAVTKTYHTLKDLISGKFKKDNNEVNDELNNVTVQPAQVQSSVLRESDDYRSPYSALPIHMRQGLNQSQPNIWNGKAVPMDQHGQTQLSPSNGRSSYEVTNRGVQQQRANSQPQLNVPGFERRGSQTLLDQANDRRGSLANIDVTDSDEGGFATRSTVRRPQTMYQMQHPNQQHQHQLHSNSINSPSQFHSANLSNSQYIVSPYQHTHMSPGHYNGNSNHLPLQQEQSNQSTINKSNGNMNYSTQHDSINQQDISNYGQSRQDMLRASFQKQLQDNQQLQLNQQNGHFNQNLHHQSTGLLKINQRTDGRTQLGSDISKSVPESAGSSDYDKSGNQSSNVDSGRGSAVYSSGRKAQQDTECSDSPVRNTKNDDSEWVDIVDAELRHILEPGIQGLSIRQESTVSGSVSSVSPPLPPLSPDNSSYKPIKTKEPSKQEYGTDSYNRPGRNSGPIGPSRAGWPGSSVQKQNHSRSSGKKHDQTLLKRHLFGLDNDMTSTTTRSLDLDSLLGGQWGTGQSVSDSETDTQGIRHIRSQLEGLEHMYGEVLKMLGSRAPNRLHDAPLRNGPARRRHGSLSSLPSSSVSSRPIRDRRRNDDRRKVRDMKGINKRFQRLESHVVTLARSVAHLSSEMRSQHLVTQELERLRDELTTLRSQTARSQHIFRSSEPEPPNLTNPRRVKKLTKFFGDDPPLMRLFLKNLGYEKYANLFEAERVGMIELPYLGEERLQKLGVPLGPRLRILQEAQISLCKDTTLCIV